MNILIKGGELVDPVSGVVQQQDILIENGNIAKIVPTGELKEQQQLKVIDVSGKIIVPGLIDMHVHLREPGQEYKETVMSGAMAGVAGGFTALACMPNTDPINDSSTVTEYIMKQAKKNDLLKVYPIAAITKDMKGETLTEFGDLKNSGAKGLSDDGLPVKNSEVMRRALEYANYHQLAVISHCEDTSLSAGGVMHEGVVSAQIGLQGIPSASEEVMVQREISLAKLTNCPVHIAHVSCEGSVDAIRRAKEQGIKVTAETAPHYFSLDHSVVAGYDTNTKMNPPLRTLEDVQAIKDGLASDVIDVIATDHAPHDPLSKRVEFDKAAFGIIGLQTALPLTLALVRDGILSLASAVRKLTYNPATILRVPGGVLTEGESADLTVIDPETKYILTDNDILSNSKNSPFLGKELMGRSILTMVGGKIVWEEDE